MNKNVFYIILTIVFLLTSCASEESGLQQGYIAKAKEVSVKYGLDDARFSFTYEGEVFSIDSRKFSNLSDEQKYLYLRDIDKIVENSNPRAWVMIGSGDVYQLHPDFELAFSDSGSGLIFPYGTPTGIPDDRIVFNPPVRPELISDNEHGLILAGDTISYLIDYERYHWKLPYEERAELNKIYDKGYAYYITDIANILLLEIDGDFAKIQLLDSPSGKKPGTIGWIRVSNIKSYPKP